jgi:hypothetical protein
MTLRPRRLAVGAGADAATAPGPWCGHPPPSARVHLVVLGWWCAPPRLPPLGQARRHHPNNTPNCVSCGSRAPLQVTTRSQAAASAAPSPSPAAPATTQKAPVKLSGEGHWHSFGHFHMLEGPFAYLADNEFIHRGYRMGLSWWQCWCSVFHLHNETVNIWSHGVGAIVFLGFMVHLVLNSALLLPAALLSPSGPLVVQGGLHTSSLYQHAVLGSPLYADSDWAVTSRFPTVSTVHYYLQTLTAATSSLGTGAVPCRAVPCRAVPCRAAPSGVWLCLGRGCVFPGGHCPNLPPPRCRCVLPVVAAGALHAVADLEGALLNLKVCCHPLAFRPRVVGAHFTIAPCALRYARPWSRPCVPGRDCELPAQCNSGCPGAAEGPEQSGGRAAGVAG